MSERGRRWTVMEVLDWTRGHFEAKGLESPRLDAEVLLAHTLGMERVMLYARFDQPMQAEELAKMRDQVARRAAGTPVAHLTGRREFWSLKLEITPDVLIPRGDTEKLVEVAVERSENPGVVVDVGAGSGAVALALAKERPNARVLATEVSPAAAAVARRNASVLGVSVEVLEGHLLAPLPSGLEVDLLVANLPYIPTGELGGLQLEVQQEPRLALDGGADGLDLIRALITEARSVLRPGAIIALESTSGQTSTIAALLADAGYVEGRVDQDLAGLDRVTSARWPSMEGS